MVQETNLSERVTVVTGVSSFIGCHLAAHFSRLGARVVGTISKSVHAYKRPQSERLTFVSEAGICLRELDITDKQQLQNFVHRVSPDIWIHHAGWAEQYASLEYDLEKGFEVNVAPLEILYPALSEARAAGIIVTGSSSEYGDGLQPHVEDETCWPTTPYGLSKLFETIRSRQMSTQYLVPTRVARVFIPYGTLDTPGRLIPSVVEALRNNRQIDLSPCEQRRDFVSVIDLAKAYEALIENLGSGTLFDVVNVCGGEAVSLRSLLLKIAEMMDASPALLNFGKLAMRAGEAPVVCGSAAKAMSELNWRSSSLDEGLRAYIGATRLS